MRKVAAIIKRATVSQWKEHCSFRKHARVQGLLGSEHFLSCLFFPHIHQYYSLLPFIPLGINFKIPPGDAEYNFFNAGCRKSVLKTNLCQHN